MFFRNAFLALYVMDLDTLSEQGYQLRRHFEDFSNNQLLFYTVKNILQIFTSNKLFIEQFLKFNDH